MVRESPIGIENFDEVIQQNCFYVDKTEFIKSWWESKPKSTLITRPRRFGKTLTMSMINCFFSVQYANRADLFQNLKIWQYEEFRKIQGTYPVIFLSMANVIKTSVKGVVSEIARSIWNICNSYRWILESPSLTNTQKSYFESLTYQMDRDTVEGALNQLCEIFYRVFDKKTIILLDEYDTPMITAYNKGYWGEIADFMRSFFNATFKTNLYLDKGLMSGITRVTKESMFSGLNNLKVVTTTSTEYADVFGFTEEEVFAAMDAQGKSETEKQEVKRYYDGFTFGNRKEIYNPWSIINYFDTGRLEPYWANTSSNEILEDVIHRSDIQFKCDLERLISNEAITVPIDENISFKNLYTNANATWSLLLAAGYLKVEGRKGNLYTLSLTNYEVRKTFEEVIKNWISQGNAAYDEFIQAMLAGNVNVMNVKLNTYASRVFSTFDIGGKEPEIFYHGFALGLAAQLHNEYYIYSNRESGDGRADVWLYRRDNTGDAIILEFKALDEEAKEEEFFKAVKAALKQIEYNEYVTDLYNYGFDDSRIRKYGIAFSKKKCLIGDK